jgi:creatinine amidohydrolase
LSFILHEMSWDGAAEYFRDNEVAILPVGSNEQHGYHAPLGTDHFIAKALAEEAATRTGVLCLQVIPFGVSFVHRQFGGTISISPQHFKDYVEDVCRSLTYYGIRRIVIVNGHGGNRSALTDLAYELRADGVFATIFTWWEAAATLLPNIFTPTQRRHAGAEETSLVLHLHPKLVNMKKATDENSPSHPTTAAGVALPLDNIDHTMSGVLGNSTASSAEKGREVFEAVVKELVTHIQLVKETNPGELRAKSGRD